MKKIIELIGETSGLLAEIKAHPDYQSLVKRGYKPELNLEDVYAILGNVMWQITPSLYRGSR